MGFIQNLKNKGAKITPKSGTVGTSWTLITGIGPVMGFTIFNSNTGSKTLLYSFDNGTNEFRVPPLSSAEVEGGKKLYVKGSASATPYELKIAQYQ